MAEQPTAADLAKRGFTPQQIRRLKTLREVYPLIELVDSNEALLRLHFLKWRYTQHHVTV